MTSTFELDHKVTDWNDPRQAVHVVAEFASADQVIRGARAAGAMIIELRLNGIFDEDELLGVLNRTFRFPHRTTNFDAAIDWISDLGWMPSAAGYVVVIRGLDHCPQEVVDTMAGIMPPILERCRTGGITFVTILVSNTSRDVVTAALSEANKGLDEHAALSWTSNSTGAVLVTYDR